MRVVVTAIGKFASFDLYGIALTARFRQGG
jgi:hypothetical protein